MFLEYVVSVLQKRTNITEIYTAVNGKDAFSKLHDKRIDLLITDLNMPGFNGIDLIEKTKADYPEVKVVVLTQYCNKGLIRKLKKLKVDGFLTKSASQNDLNEMLDGILAGNSLFKKQKEIDSTSLEENHTADLLSDAYKWLSQLSDRENEIMKLLLENKSNQEIADYLFIWVETVATHRKNIYRKLKVNNILDLYKLVTNRNE